MYDSDEKAYLFAHSGGPQGAPGKGSYDLSAYLKRELAESYQIFDTLIVDPEAPTYEMWKAMFDAQLGTLTQPFVLIGHSPGGSILIKYRSDERPVNSIAGLFLIAIPQWSPDVWDIVDFALREILKQRSRPWARFSFTIVSMPR